MLRCCCHRSVAQHTHTQSRTDGNESELKASIALQMRKLLKVPMATAARSRGISSERDRTGGSVTDGVCVADGDASKRKTMSKSHSRKSVKYFSILRFKTRPTETTVCLAGTKLKSGKVMLRPILEIGTEGVLAQVLVLVLACPPLQRPTRGSASRRRDRGGQLAVTRPTGRSKPASPSCWQRFALADRLMEHCCRNQNG